MVDSGNNFFIKISFDSLDSPALTKAQLSEMLHQQLGLNKREAKDFIDAFFGRVIDELVQGRDVKLSGFGNFEVRTKSARPGRNPRTGMPALIDSRRVVIFRPSPMLRSQINKD